jgi:hypothetical protein
VRQQVVGAKGLSGKIDEVVSLVRNHLPSAAELFQKANQDLLDLRNDAFGEGAEEQLDEVERYF